MPWKQLISGARGEAQAVTRRKEEEKRREKKRRGEREKREKGKKGGGGQVAVAVGQKARPFPPPFVRGAAPR